MPEENQWQQESHETGKPKFLTQTRFDSFDLPEALLKGLNESGLIQCTPIQDQALPISLEGRDVAGQAQTGTGKTAAFLVTVFSHILQRKKKKSNLPSALIVAPTRELALQIHEEAGAIGRYCGLKLGNVIGGVDYRRQANMLRKGVDIVVCTPGRIIDYFKQNIFKTQDIQIVVIDEADRLLDLGFAKDMRFILSKLPHYEKRQSMLFSATLSYRVMELTYDYMNLPEFISITPEDVTVEGIDQQLFHVGNEKKLSLLLGLLKREEWNRLLIFVNTKIGVEWLSQKLSGNGWPAEAITGDLPQRKRFRLMEKFKNGQIKILVATDVASRGIHVEDISHVINFDLPQDAENYVHRIGRTARAGRTGRAISLACEKYVFHLEPLEKMLGYKIPVIWPKEDWYLDDHCGPVKIDGNGDRKKGRREKKRTKRPHGRSKQPRNKKPAKKTTFPGAFFGFGPPEKPKGRKPAGKKESTARTDQPGKGKNS
jgi:ATP-dependent RNA helicase RhlB